MGGGELRKGVNPVVDAHLLLQLDFLQEDGNREREREREIESEIYTHSNVCMWHAPHTDEVRFLPAARTNIPEESGRLEVST